MIKGQRYKGFDSNNDSFSDIDPFNVNGAQFLHD